MKTILIEFINTLETSLKKFQANVNPANGLSRLTIHQYEYINAISELGEPTLTEIAMKLNVTKASVTASIKKLVSMGYVIKTQSETDKRFFYIRLTDASQQLVAAKQETFNEYEALIQSALTQEEIIQFEHILNKLVKAFDQAA